jgi:hypothetical protein
MFFSLTRQSDERFRQIVRLRDCAVPNNCGSRIRGVEWIPTGSVFLRSVAFGVVNPSGFGVDSFTSFFLLPVVPTLRVSSSDGALVCASRSSRLRTVA